MAAPIVAVIRKPQKPQKPKPAPRIIVGLQGVGLSGVTDLGTF